MFSIRKGNLSSKSYNRQSFKANVIIITSTKLCNYYVAHTTFCSSGECCDSFGVCTSSFVVLSVSPGRGSCLSSKILRKAMLLFKMQAIKEWKKRLSLY